jgi:hypothetical protein
MKIRVLLVSLTLVGAIFARTALAQAPNPVAEAQWQRYLARHPDAQAGLANDQNYLAKNRGMAKRLQEHPAVAANARRQRQVGGWDKSNQWHDRNWWAHNDPAWVHEHHREWVEEAQENHGEEGEWDEHHHWHARHWGKKHDPESVDHQHPGWYESEEHRGHHDHGEDHYDKD